MARLRNSLWWYLFVPSQHIASVREPRRSLSPACGLRNATDLGVTRTRICSSRAVHTGKQGMTRTSSPRAHRQHEPVEHGGAAVRMQARPQL
jgi:hypothetical protein